MSFGTWESYRHAQESFEKIVPRQTTVGDLNAFRLDPYTSPNVAILNYADVARRFLPDSGAVAFSDLDENIQFCLKAKTACTAWQIHQDWKDTQHTGNFFAEFFGFKRKTETSGWSFDALVLLKDDVVVYKLTGGQPAIREHDEKSNPMGPLGGIAKRIFGFFF